MLGLPPVLAVVGGVPLEGFAGPGCAGDVGGVDALAAPGTGGCIAAEPGRSPNVIDLLIPILTEKKPGPVP